MGFLNYGGAQALSYKHDFQGDIDRLYQREAYRAEVQANKERKTQYYASLMQEETAVSPAINGQLEEYYKDLNNQIADFAINNPNFETDVNKMQEFMSMTDGYLNNDLIRMDKQAQVEFEKLKEAYGSKGITQTKWLKEMEKYETWMETGQDPYVFSNPEKFSVDEIVTDINNLLEADVKKTSDGVVITETREVSDDRIMQSAMFAYNNEDKKISIDEEFNAMDEKGQAFFDGSAVNYIAARIKQGEARYDDNTGYDELFKINVRSAATKKAADKAYQRFYIANVYNTLSARGETSANPANSYLTEFGGPKTHMAMGVNGKAVKYYGKDEVPEEMNLYGDVYTVGAGKIFMQGGVAMVEVSVGVIANAGRHLNIETKDGDIYKDGSKIKYDSLSPEAQSYVESVDGEYQMKQDDTYAKYLTDRGFTESKITTTGLVPDFGGGITTADAFVGTIIVPADFSQANRQNYDKSFHGSGVKLMEATATGIYGEAQNLLDLYQSNLGPQVNETINKVATKKILAATGVEEPNLNWSPAQHDPSKWIAEGTGEVDYVYDSQTGSVTPVN